MKQNDEIFKLLDKKDITAEDLGRVLIYAYCINQEKKPEMSVLFDTCFAERLTELQEKNPLAWLEYLHYYNLNDWIKYARVFVGMYEQIGNLLSINFATTLSDFSFFISAIAHGEDTMNKDVKEMMFNYSEEIKSRVINNVDSLKKAYKICFTFNIIIEVLKKTCSIDKLSVYSVDLSVIEENIDSYNEDLKIIKKIISKDEQTKKRFDDLPIISVNKFQLTKKQREMAQEMFGDVQMFQSDWAGLSLYPIRKIARF